MFKWNWCLYYGNLRGLIFWWLSSYYFSLLFLDNDIIYFYGSIIIELIQRILRILKSYNSICNWEKWTNDSLCWTSIKRSNFSILWSISFYKFNNYKNYNLIYIFIKNITFISLNSLYNLNPSSANKKYKITIWKLFYSF